MPPELDEDGVEPAEGVVEGLEDDAVVDEVLVGDDAFFGSGSGVNGSCAMP